MSVVTNLASMTAYHSLQRTSSALEQSQRRLATGLRITRAADDAAGLGISEGLKSQIGGMSRAVRNAQDGVSVLQIADGALGNQTTILQRMRDLAVQAGNDAVLDLDARTNVQAELNQLGDQLDTIAARTAFNGVNLLDGRYAGLFQVGAYSGQTIPVTIGGGARGMDRKGLDLLGLDVRDSVQLPASMTAAVSAAQGVPSAGRISFTGDYVNSPAAEANFRALEGTITYNGKTFDLGSVDYTGAVTQSDYLLKLNQKALTDLGLTGYPFGASPAQLVFNGDVPAAGSTLADADLLSPMYYGHSGAAQAITMIDKAIARISSTRADLGAVQNRFEHTITRLQGAVEDATASESRIQDTDMAAEFTTMSRLNVLTQAGTAMLANANQSSQSILKLLAA
ncbi:flagellin [Petropleomorpha daqingensis]|uniref:Flagellin n=1 Tax=Petropleomorpha daqingensis TaxID=2026353 RepID=A0A853CEH9_9ACTN|nr:flagellin [Petropleomorpha daqingensis]NYJ06415.1 flagellin [Petropleomorpha daqingensis]